MAASHCPPDSKSALTDSTGHPLIRQIKKTLSDANAPVTHLVLRKCLSKLTDATLLSSLKDSSDSLIILKMLRDYSRHNDSRVRSAALSGLLKLHESGVKLDISLYSEFCEGLKDDYEDCRIVSIKLLQVLSQSYADCLVCVSSGDEQIRLVDDAFARICSMVSDLSINVRTEAAGLLGSFSNVSPHFLDQTLDKKLMSNLRKKKSAHERNRDAFSSGEWSSGKKWADDAPQEGICPEQISLMDIGACGAFVHGLEDEFLEVRMATLHSLLHLSKAFPDFAHQSLDFLVDMFNDEIEEIRLKAIQVLSEVGLESVVLRDDQIQIILSAFEENSSEIREALYQMLGNCKVESEDSLKSCTETLLENLRKHPDDRMCIWMSLKNLGSSHAEFVSLLVTDLLGIHPFLDLPEPSIDDPSYISLLILTLNAAAKLPKITSLLEHYTERHYSYLRHAHPDLVPQLTEYEKDHVVLGKRKFDDEDNSLTSARRFLCDIFKRLRQTIESKGLSTQAAVIELSIKDLTRLRRTERAVSSACDFLIHYLDCQLSIRKILTNSNWINALLLSPLQSSIFRSSLQNILVTTFTLSHRFHGMHPFQSTLIQQTRVKALALQLVAIIHGSNASALSLCDAFLEELQHLRLSLKTCGIRADALTESMMKQISLLDEPKPGSVARVLQPLFLSSESVIQFSDLSQMANDETIDSLVCMTVSSADIVEPQPRSDSVIRFTSGLVLAIKFQANIRNITDTRIIRIKIKFPDQKVHLFIPKSADFKEMPFQKSVDAGVKDYKLTTNVYLSHTTWTEPCQVEMSVVLDFRETSSAITISQFWAAKTGPYALSSNSGSKGKSDENMLIDLCKPIKVTICPRAVRKAVL